MDKDFEALLARMHRQRQVEALTKGIVIFLGGMAIGFTITAWLAGII